MAPRRPAHPQLTTVDGLAQLSFLIHGLLETHASERGLSIVQTRLLGILRDRTAVMSELATMLGLDKSSVTGLVTRAERRGLVAREPSPSDRRAVLVGLTERGRALAAEVSSGFETDVRSLLAALPATDRRTLSALVQDVVSAHADQHGIDLFPAGS